jgi:hypothetical protein
MFLSADLYTDYLCLYSSNLGTFWLKIEQFWPFEEIYIFSNSSHFEWRAGLSDTLLKGDHPRTIPAKFALIWFPFKMAAVTKNRNFFNCPLLLYYKSK